MTEPPASPPFAHAAAQPEPRRRLLSPRARFRARLDRDPRRWILLIVALGSMAGPMLGLASDRELAEFGVQHILFTLFLPLWGIAGILGMFLHCRLLLWTGRWLGGAAKAPELHAAFAWSQLPAALIAAPFLLLLPLRLAAADPDPVPGWLQASLHFAEAASAPMSALWLVAILVGVLLWVLYLAEAQRFAVWRALANEALALVVIAVPGLGIIAAVAGIVPSARELAQVGIALAALVTLIGAAALIEHVVRRRSRAA